MVISFSIIFMGMLNVWERGPSSFSISLRFCMSVLSTAPIRGTVATYAAKKISAPTISFIQLGRFSWDRIV